jgi:two-component system, NtrC family, sensor kinase
MATDSLDIASDAQPSQHWQLPAWLGPTLGVSVLGTVVAAILTWAWTEPSRLQLVSVGLGTLAVIGLLLSLAYRRGLAALHQAIAEARVGQLVPVETSPWVRALLRPMVEDYDAMSRDLTSLFREMELAQLSIIGERNSHEAILQSLPGALLIVDAEMRVTRSNRQAELLFRRTREAMSGANLLDLMRTDDAGRQLVRDAFQTAQTVRNAICELVIDEDARRASLNLTFFRQSSKSADSSAAVILQDVTEHRRVEELTHQTEKLVAMGELAGGVAHELNTPLGTILGYAQLLDEGRASGERQAQYARAIYDEAHRCARIIDDLLAYARRPPCDPVCADLNSLVREASDAVANCQGRRLGVPIETILGAAVCVRGSAGQLDIVLVNLLVNATQAAASAAQPQVCISCSTEGEYAVVSVTDNGPGVSAEVRRKIFDPFFTTKRDGIGTGLGLALSHSIVTRIGGMLDCDPLHGMGARFVLRLPLVARCA